MKLNDLQPRKALQEIILRREKLLTRIFDKNNLSNDDFETIDSCPICKNSEVDGFGKKFNVEFVRCRVCCFIYQKTKIKDEVRNNLFRESEYFDATTQNIQINTYNKRKYEKFGPILKRIETVIPAEKPAKLLDIGCSAGYFLDLVREKTQWDGVGVELNRIAVDFAQSNGLNVLCENIMEADFENSSFDIISVFGVMGRLAQPGAFIKKCNDLLKNKGHLIITTPNCLGYEFSVLGSEHKYFDPLDTNCGYNINNINRLLENFSFQTVSTGTPGDFDLEIVRRHIEDYDLDIKLNSFEKAMLFSEDTHMDKARSEFTIFLKKFKMSGLMEIIAQKVDGEV